MLRKMSILSPVKVWLGVSTRYDYSVEVANDARLYPARSHITKKNIVGTVYPCKPQLAEHIAKVKDSSFILHRRNSYSTSSIRPLEYLTWAKSVGFQETPMLGGRRHPSVSFTYDAFRKGKSVNYETRKLMQGI